MAPTSKTPLTDENNTRGTIYTFYSYKGGVGRSMMMANIAMYFYQRRQTVLMVDWDLEAPGLERYFQKRFGDDKYAEMATHRGLLDMLLDFRQWMMSPPTESEEIELDKTPPNLDELFKDFRPELYAYTLEEQGAAKLMLMTSGVKKEDGQITDEYANTISHFNWREFYNNFAYVYFEWLRKKLKTIADVILLDCRTGVTEIGGIATQLFADHVILVCGPNAENVNNTLSMAQRLTSPKLWEDRGNRSIGVLPVPSRIDGDADGFKPFLDKINEMFEGVKIPIFEDPRASKLDEIFLPYTSAYAFQEDVIISTTEEFDRGARLAERYHRVANNMMYMAAEGSALYALAELGNIGFIDVAMIYHRQDGEIARRLIPLIMRNQKDIKVWDIPNERNAQKALREAKVAVVLWSETARDSNSFITLLGDVVNHSLPLLLVREDKTKLPDFKLESTINHFQNQEKDKEIVEELLQRIQSLGRYRALQTDTDSFDDDFEFEMNDFELRIKSLHFQIVKLMKDSDHQRALDEADAFYQDVQGNFERAKTLELAPQVGSVAGYVSKTNRRDLALDLFDLALTLDSNHITNIQNYIGYILDDSINDRYFSAGEWLNHLKDNLRRRDQRPARTKILELRLGEKEGASDIINQLIQIEIDSTDTLSLVMNALVERQEYDACEKVTMKFYYESTNPDIRRGALRMLADVLGSSPEKNYQDIALQIYLFLLNQDKINRQNFDDLRSFEKLNISPEMAMMMHNFAALLSQRNYNYEAGVLWYYAYFAFPENKAIRSAYSSYMSLTVGRSDIAMQVVRGVVPLKTRILPERRGGLPQRFTALPHQWWLRAENS